jgi:DNA polymerase-3 subunit alpha
MVWPKVYVDTRELWQEGNMLIVEGRVRLRDDQVQLNCEHVRHYEAQAAEVEAASAEPDEAPLVAEKMQADTVPAQSRRLVISISETGDEAGDIASLNRLLDTLRDFPGQDEVSLRVTNAAKVINLRLSSMYTGYCPELHQRLVALVGEEGLRLELIQNT